MGIEIKRWPVEPDMYDMSPAFKNGVALQAFDTDRHEAAGNVHVLPESIAVEPVVLIASYALHASAAVKSAFKH